MAVSFEPSRTAALARVDAIDARAYSRTRNALDGRVTGLGPYLTHGLTDVPEILSSLDARGVSRQEKIVFELAWREYWHHVWRHIGDSIFAPIRATPYGQPACEELPADVLEARTGVPAIDSAVRSLYETGYVHNHARMWVASYVVHVRKVSWLAGARWFYTHLLDGDLASNTLSWQWVAGTFTGKPYFFNNDNVARHAPALARAGTAIDCSYEAMESLARSGADAGPEPGTSDGLTPPDALPQPPIVCSPLPDLTGRTVRLVHPWCLGERGDEDIALGILHRPFHERHPWSRRRWSFVLDRMTAVTDIIWSGDLDELRPWVRAARHVTCTATSNPGYAEMLPALCHSMNAAPRAFIDPPSLQRSFSQFWRKVTDAA